MFVLQLNSSVIYSTHWQIYPIYCCRGFGKQGYQCQGKKVKTDLIGFTTCSGVTMRRNLGHVLLVFQSVVSSFTSDVTNMWLSRVRGPTKEPTRTWVPTLYLMPNTYPLYIFLRAQTISSFLPFCPQSRILSKAFDENWVLQILRYPELITQITFALIIYFYIWYLRERWDCTI